MMMNNEKAELRFEEAVALRDKIRKINEEHLTSSEVLAEAELKAAFKPKKRPRQKEGASSAY